METRSMAIRSVFTECGYFICGPIIRCHMDVGNEIGGNTPTTGNTITNWEAAPPTLHFFLRAALIFGILVNHQK